MVQFESLRALPFFWHLAFEKQIHRRFATGIKVGKRFFVLSGQNFHTSGKSECELLHYSLQCIGVEQKRRRGGGGWEVPADGYTNTNCLDENSLA